MATSATPATRSKGECRQVAPCHAKCGGVTGDRVAKCHACHAKRRGVTGDQARPSAPPEPAQCHKCHACHAKRRWMPPSTTPATRNEGGCRQVPHLPRKVPRRHRRPSAPPEPAQCHKCHACHAKRRRMPPSATPATRNEGGCRQVLRLLRKVPWRHRRPSAPPEPAQCHKCHACHAKRRWMPPSATPATRNEGGCRRVPRLPRKVPRRHRRPSAPKCATRAVSATPATQNKLCERWCVKDGVCER